MSSTISYTSSHIRRDPIFHIKVNNGQSQFSCTQLKTGCGGGFCSLSCNVKWMLKHLFLLLQLSLSSTHKCLNMTCFSQFLSAYSITYIFHVSLLYLLCYICQLCIYMIGKICVKGRKKKSHHLYSSDQVTICSDVRSLF